MARGQTGTLLQHLRNLMHAEVTADLMDTELLQRFAAQHDEATYAALLRRQGPRCCDCACGSSTTRTTPSRPSASDPLGSVRNTEMLGSWLSAVAHRGAVKVFQAAPPMRKASA